MRLIFIELNRFQQFLKFKRMKLQI